MKYLLLSLLLLIPSGVFAEDIIYGLPDIKLELSTGVETNFQDYKGKVLLIVNTASGCGYTPQLKDLQKLQEKYGDKGFSVLGFPSNDFNQEPGSDEEIKSFCEDQYGVTFPLFRKAPVKGSKQQPVYWYLKSQSGKEVKWNFEKFLVDRRGRVVGHFLSAVNPLDEKITSKIEVSL